MPRATRSALKRSLPQQLLVLALCLAALPFAARAQEALPTPAWHGKVDVMLQGFHWNSSSNTTKKGVRQPWWRVIAKKANTIGKHFDAVWLPPASKAAVEDKHGPTAQGYLPYSLNDLNSDYGSEKELSQALDRLTGKRAQQLLASHRPFSRHALKRLNRKGVLAIADIVPNHISSTRNVKSGTTFHMDPARDTFVDLTAKDIVRESGGAGHPDTGKQFPLVADVDHQSEHTKQVYTGMLQRLSRIGYKGVRYDFAKGYAPQVIGTYNNATQPNFSVAELWEDFHGADSHRQQLLNYVKKTGYTTSTFDFTTKAVLQEAVGRREYWRLKDGQGRPAGLIGVAPEYAVTFVDNHDTGSSPGGNGQGGQKHWEFPGDKVMEGYAYVLTHPGVPCVYWPHYFDWTSPYQKNGMKVELDRLIGLRKQMGIAASSNVQIATADNRHYAAYVAGERGTMAMKIGPGNWQPDRPGNWQLAAHGLNYAVWTLKKQTSKK